MRRVAEYLLTVGGPIALLSGAMMAHYLVRNRVRTWWQVRREFLWPKIIFEYRDHSRRYRGKAGIWYYVFSISVFFVFIASSIELAMITASAPLPLIIVVSFTYLVLVPLVGYVIHMLSREKYF
jgi:hypothetical protein